MSDEPVSIDTVAWQGLLPARAVEAINWNKELSPYQKAELEALETTGSAEFDLEKWNKTGKI